MSDAHSNLTSRAAELRLKFDRSFAEPSYAEAIPTEDFLAIRLEQEPYAIRLADIAGLFTNKKITQLPGDTTATLARGLLGIAGFRQGMVPVYDLPALLGHPAAAVRRWLFIMAAAPVALAFDTLDGHLRISRERIMPQTAGEDSRCHVREFLHGGDHVRPILHLASLLAAVKDQAGKGAAATNKIEEQSA